MTEENTPTKPPPQAALAEIQAELLTTQRRLLDADSIAEIRSLAREVAVLESEARLVTDLGLNVERRRGGQRRQAIQAAANPPPPAHRRHRNQRGVFV